MSKSRYADVRSEVSYLLRLAEQEFKLERELSQSVQDDTFGDDRRVGVLAFLLSTICHHVPEAKQRLEEAIASKHRQVALMQNRSKKHEKS